MAQEKQSSPDVQMFLGVGAFILAGLVVPDTSDVMQSQGTLYRWFFAVMAGLGGVGAFVNAARAAQFIPSPFRSTLGRILWFLRPRVWMIAWAAILGAVWVWGTPHVLFTYPAQIISNEPCTYVGYRGRVEVSTHGACKN